MPILITAWWIWVILWSEPDWSMLRLGFLFVGFMGTNTSNEIEALHKALREVGLSPTIKNDSQGLDSSMAHNTDLLQKILSTEPEKGEKIHLILYTGKYSSLFYLPVYAPFTVLVGGRIEDWANSQCPK